MTIIKRRYATKTSTSTDGFKEEGASHGEDGAISARWYLEFLVLVFHFYLRKPFSGRFERVHFCIHLFLLCMISLCLDMMGFLVTGWHDTLASICILEVTMCFNENNPNRGP